MDLQPNCVYVISPDRQLEIDDVSISASPADQQRRMRATIDVFFRSLATHGDGFAVILSGSGSDGTIGARAVKEAGGVVLVQDPREAVHDGMPRAVISSDIADVVLPVRELARRLAELSRQKARLEPIIGRPVAEENTDNDGEAALKRILDLVRARTGHDFARYKRPTVLRRIGRRMQLRHKSDLAEYAALLTDDPDEARALFVRAPARTKHGPRPDARAPRAAHRVGGAQGRVSSREDLPAVPQRGRAMSDFPERPGAPLRVGVSSCLLGQEVRHDGGHKRSALCHDALAGLFELRGICPEVGIGMGVPREPIHLVGDPKAPRARGVKDTSLDVTVRLRDFARAIDAALDDVSGYIFIRGSPSCGLFRVKVYPSAGGAPAAVGRGIYAAELTRLRPNLPVEENGRLEDSVLRENFVTRVFCYAHWQRLRAAGLTAAGVIEFHSRYKYLLMAHSISHYQQAGRLLSDLRNEPVARAERYFALLMEGLTRPATRGGHANVLQHLQGYVREGLDSPSRRELAATIDSYRRGEVPLLAALTLLRHHLVRHGSAYVQAQTYLEPHPPAPGLRRAL